VEFFDAVEARQSVRVFEQRPISDGKAILPQVPKVRRTQVTRGAFAGRFLAEGLVLVILAGCGMKADPWQAGGTSTPSLVRREVTTSVALDGMTERRLKLVGSLVNDWGISDADVIRAMEEVPRDEFVPPEYLDQAYDNHPLPIGYGQTISQPYIVAWMTELLQLQAGERVLEIGTGSGYQAAVLAALGKADVYSIEIVPELAEQAEVRLDRLGYSNIHTKQGDGYFGWPDQAPFDAIIVTAAPDHVPAPLAAQLTDGGRMVIPIGPPGGYQSLWKFVKKDGQLAAENLGGVAFVPFTGGGSEGGAAQPTHAP
jgi:protein-L-isoaspartate(D-aspartate) O-methyltransferase